MSSLVQTYKKVARTIANPRETEANLLLHAASRLYSIQESWEAKKSELQEALLYNRKLWTVFMTSATSPDNPLPIAIRQNVANLGIFVVNHTLSVSADPRPASLDCLIGINRNLAAGLLNRP